MYTVHVGSYVGLADHRIGEHKLSVAAACTTLDAANARALEMLWADIARDRGKPFKTTAAYTVVRNGAEVCRFERDKDDTVTCVSFTDETEHELETIHDRDARAALAWLLAHPKPQGLSSTIVATAWVLADEMAAERVQRQGAKK